MDIDLVYLWVNGNDPKWIAKRDACIGRPTDQQDNCVGRYADSGELKYSLRSVERYAPWIHRIFIVTDNQVPEWLDTNHPKIQIVDHKDILPAESLPCFNSTLIEHFIDRIPGLSEHFIFSNDDMYLNKCIKPDTFFARDGLPILYMNRKPLRKFELWFREKVLRKPLSTYLKQIRNASQLVEERYGTYYGCKLHHNMDAYLKSTITHTNQIFAEEFSKMITHHERSAEDVQRIIYSYVALAEKKGHLQYVSQDHSFRLHIDNRKHYKKFERKHPVFFCMNDSEYATDADREFAAAYREKLFPYQSDFEIVETK